MNLMTARTTTLTTSYFANHTRAGDARGTEDGGYDGLHRQQDRELDRIAAGRPAGDRRRRGLLRAGL